MVEKIYTQLRDYVDQIGAGFNATTTGAELRLLEYLFDVEEAYIYMNLTEKLETPDVIAKRAGKDPGEVAGILDRMNKKGLVVPGQKGELRYFSAAPFAQGIIEHQVERMDSKFAELFEAYIIEYQPRGPIPMRTIPVGKAVSSDRVVSPYDDIKALIRRQDRIAVAKCFCAKVKEVGGNPCDQPLEVCFSLNFFADYYVENGLARWVSHKEATEILDRCEEYGLVSQPINMKNPGFICNCCPKCCAPFQGLKLHPAPASLLSSNYYAQVSSELCSACEICLDRCPTEAIAIGSEDVVEVNRDRCIGCGLCTVKCPTDALVLRQKPETELQEPPDRIPFLKPGEEYESDMKP